MQPLALLKSIIDEEYYTERKIFMKKITKIISVILSISVFISCIITSHAEDDKGLTEAILRVKSVIDVPAEYSEFDYGSYSHNGKNIWSLTWSGDRGFVDVAVDDSGTILNYYYSDRDRDKSSWANITTAEAKAMADEFVKKVDTALSEKLVYAESNGYGANTVFTYAETIDGIKLYNRHVTVTVDRVNKKVTGYSSEGVTGKEAEKGFEHISNEEALKLYAEKIGAKIVYRKDYYYKNKTVNTYPVYVLKNTGLTAVSALTKELVSYKSSEGEVGYAGGATSNDMADMESVKSESSSLTREELEAVEAVSGLMSSEQADGLIKKEFPALEGVSVSSVSLNKDYYADRYYYNIRYRSEGDKYLSANAKLDAKTGALLSWSFSDSNYTYESQITEAEAKKIAMSFIDRFASDDFHSCGDISAESYGKESVSYRFSAPRLVNGAEVEGESIGVTVNPEGEVTYFSNTFTVDTEFSPLDNVIDENTAVEKLAEYGGFGLMYAYTGEKYEPVYEIENKYVETDPFTGERYQRNMTSEIPENYTDIEGHWAQNIIETLLDNGYYTEGESFMPEQAITVKEFLSYAKFIYGKDDDYIKAYAVSVENAENIDVNAPLTREVAAKYITADMGADRIAEHSEIFIYPFNDSEAVSEGFIGHIAVCFAEKVFAGDNFGNFNPKKQMTRAEAAAVIYNYYSQR